MNKIGYIAALGALHGIACGPTVPACNSPEVVALATDVARKIVIDYELSEFGELTAESSSGRRMCVCAASSKLLGSEALMRKFALSAMDGGRFYLQFTP